MRIRNITFKSTSDKSQYAELLVNGETGSRLYQVALSKKLLGFNRMCFLISRPYVPTSHNKSPYLPRITKVISDSKVEEKEYLRTGDTVQG